MSLQFTHVPPLPTEASCESGLFYCWSLLRNNTQGNKSSKVDFILRWQAFCCIRLLNADILAGNAARQWHADSGKLPIFILCEKKHEWVYRRATQIFQAKVQSKIVEVRSLLWNHTNVPCLRFFQQKTWNDSIIRLCVYMHIKNRVNRYKY